MIIEIKEVWINLIEVGLELILVIMGCLLILIIFVVGNVLIVDIFNVILVLLDSDGL